MVVGAAGMVGQALCSYCQASGDIVLPYDRQRLDITDTKGVMDAVDREIPDTIINCSAWTDVDGCESDPARARAVNSNGPKNLAKAARRASAGFITISTDYVFDGEKEGFYTQRDDPNPRSVYAVSKLEGERQAQTAYARTIVVRTGFVFGPGGRNFLSTIMQRAASGKSLKTISDARGTPTYSPDLAARLRYLAEVDLPGTYHVVNSGEGATFEDFAYAAVEEAGYPNVVIESVPMESLNRPAARPRNSCLRCLLSEAMGLPALPHWRSGLKRFAELLGDSEIAAQG
jgi:dTDP-4-dehydrorhamnose reductase